MQRRKTPICWLPVLLLFILAATQAQPTRATQQQTLLTPPVRTALEAIRPERIRAHVQYLADDRLEGRDTGTPGGELAARYLATQFQELGLKPVGDNGTYYQQVPFRYGAVDPERSHLRIGDPKDQAVTLSLGTDLLYNGHNLAAGGFRAPLVFAGFGITAPEYQYDDYRGLEVKGKIVVVLAGEPASDDPKFFAGTEDTPHADGGDKIRRARAKGAVAIITVLHGPMAARYPWESARRGQQRSRLFVRQPSDHFPALLASSAGAKKLFSTAPVSWEATQKATKSPRSFAWKSPAELKLTWSETPRTAPNVVGMLEGSDPQLKHQVVVYTAHYDHVGKRDGEGDTIFNGAWDNASGTAGVLETARAFTALRPAPKRSVLFLLVTGEEYGLFGSQYYVHHPLVPLKDTAANINLDMTDIFGIPKQIVAMGVEHSKDLEQASQSAARELGMELGPDPTPEMRVYTRSDQFSFANVGIPALFMRWSNTYEDLDPKAAKELMQQKLDTIYHKVEDEFDPTWSWKGMARHTEASFLIGLKLANGSHMPEWNPNTPFTKPRGSLNSAQ